MVFIMSSSFHHMTMLLAILVALALSIQSTEAQAPSEVWMLSLFANDDGKGFCRASADKIGQQIQETFNAAVPGFSTYYPDDSSGRFLRSIHRDLQVRLCSQTYCSKPANWQWCLWNGCSCSCGQRRELAVSSNASDNSKILEAKRQIDAMLATKSAELGCELGLNLQKIN
jgi:hypothetical protein